MGTDPGTSWGQAKPRGPSDRSSDQKRTTAPRAIGEIMVKYIQMKKSSSILDLVLLLGAYAYASGTVVPRTAVLGYGITVR